MLGELVAFARHGRYPAKIELDVDDFITGNGMDQQEVLWDCRQRDWCFVSMVGFETPI